MSERVSDESMSAIVVALRARAAACDCWPDCAEPGGCGTLIAAADAIEQACRERDEAQETLDRVLGKDPCPKCGCGIAATCYGCERDAALAQVAALREALARLAEAPDEMSWHGEAIKCLICGGYGVRGGYKRGEDEDKAVEHRSGCALADTSAAEAWERKVRREEREWCAKVAELACPLGPNECPHVIAAAIRAGGEDA